MVVSPAPYGVVGVDRTDVVGASIEPLDRLHEPVDPNRRGLVIRGTQKIWDSSIANIGLLYAKERGVFRCYHDRVFERFWKRELDIESVPVLAALLDECGADASDFAAYVQGEGRALLTKAQAEAEAAGVFGVTSVLLPDGDLYWGREHFPTLAEMLRAKR